MISVLLIFGFLLLAYKFTNTTQNILFPEVNIIRSDDHVKWSPEKKNILVEYSDLQCPACKTFYDLIKTQIEASGSGQTDITKKITFVYRHFPLYQAHPFAQIAAYSAEAAGRQGKFFEMENLMFARQETWVKKPDVKAEFEKYAAELKLDITQFKKDRDSQVTRDKVVADTQSAQKASVNSTPTFFLNGKKLDNIRSFDEFIQLLKGV